MIIKDFETWAFNSFSFINFINFVGVNVIAFHLAYLIYKEQSLSQVIINLQILNIFEFLPYPSIPGNPNNGFGAGLLVFFFSSNLIKLNNNKYK